ncbi:type II toxin-antitoxin system Phd/YefM family antitoxin [Mesorhizobium sp. M1406]|uniref:type II toxin-antitoxin system Phd/YefM family antitoxin n=1 Tax=Mesorhizobium sp. M1406 TaxID=2957099 RepID=UPI003337A2A6
MSKGIKRDSGQRKGRASDARVGRWKLEDAKARFSEVVRHARSDGPQRVSVRGHDAVVVVSVEEFDRLAPSRPKQPFLEFMESLHLGDLDLAREEDPGRDVDL